MIEVPTWFGPQGESLFGWFSAPDDGHATLGVLLCSSIGEEEHNAHQTYRELAEALADRGIASLRFDYHGTGDSLGHWTDPARVEAWVRSVAVAHKALRATGVSRTAAVGMRLGAALAATAASRGCVDLDALVLWDPCGGKELLREGHARRPSAVDPPEGSVDTPGYRYAAGTATDLRALDPVSLPEGRLGGHVLLLARDDRPTPRRLRARFGAEVEWATALGQSDLLDLPMTDNIVPRETLETVADWLVERAGPKQTVRMPDSSPVVLADDPSGPRIVERVVRLGSAGLVGVLTSTDHPSREPLVVLVNVANDRHVGPGRRWVDLARTWAAKGFDVLRLDQSGAGDSPCHEGQQFGTLYAREWLADLPDAMQDPQVQRRPIAFVSLCSGAYSALETAFQIDVRAVYAINPILHARVTSKASALGDPRRRAARPPIVPLLRLGDRRPRAAALMWRAYRQVTVWNAPTAAVAALVRRGTDVVLVMSPNDARHFWESAYWSTVHVPRWKRRARYRLLSSAEVDHPLMTQAGQEWAAAAITADLLDRFPQRESASAVPSLA